MTLDPCIVAQAADAWKRASRDAASDDPNGTFLDDSADQIIARVVGPYTRATARTYRAYEAAVHEMATGRPAWQRVTERRATTSKAHHKGGPKYRLTEAEREEIRARLAQGLPVRAVAKAVGRSIPLVYRVREEMTA